MGFLSDAVGGLGDLYESQAGIDNAAQQGAEAMQVAQAGADRMESQTQFKPFAVTSGVGTSSYDNGSLNMQLSGQNQAMQNQLQNSGMGMLGQQQSLADTYGQTQAAMGLGNVANEQANIMGNLQQGLGQAGLDPTNRTREQQLQSMLTSSAGGQEDIYAQLEAMQYKGRENDRLALEERLFAQGRGGVRTAQFGGTPEQLAMAQAQEQSRLQNAVQARGISQQEQQQRSSQMLAGVQQAGNETNMFGTLGLQGGQQALANLQAGSQANTAAGDMALRTQEQLANLGLSQIQGSYVPQQMLFDQMGVGNDTANLAASGQRTGAQLGASMLQAGMGTRADMAAIEGNLRQQQIQGITSLLGGKQSQNTALAQMPAGTTTSGQGWIERLLGGIL